MPNKVNGLWWGRFASPPDNANNGVTALAIDRDNSSVGRLFLAEGSPEARYAYYGFRFNFEDDRLDAQANNPIELYPEIQYPTGYSVPNIINFEGNIREENSQLYLDGTWRSDVDTNGTFSLRKDFNFKNYEPDSKYENWSEYKSEILSSKLENSALVFRGVADNKYKLNTTFHRTGRNDLVRFLDEDLRRLHRYLSPQLPRTYDLDNATQLSSFLSLAQHHGHPTPLLDWTESPFIAAFFSFWSRKQNPKYTVTDRPSRDNYVRIFEFNRSNWSRIDFNSTVILHPEQQLWFYELPGFDNPRLLPQQSVVSFANIHDIEFEIKYIEQKSGNKILKIYDLNANMCDEALRELDLMGINEATMFPGIDGTCKNLARKYF